MMQFILVLHDVFYFCENMGYIFVKQLNKIKQIFNCIIQIIH